MSDAKRTDRNQNFLDTSFLYGGNAQFVEQMAASWAEDPSSVPAEWRTYFEDNGADPAASGRAARGASWTRADWPREASGDLTSAMGAIDAAAEPALIEKVAERLPDADPADVRRATQDSIRAIMMIRAYRMRGHLAANLDPLSMSDFGVQPELQPQSYGFGRDDMVREVFIDGYLGLQTATPL